MSLDGWLVNILMADYKRIAVSLSAIRFCFCLDFRQGKGPAATNSCHRYYCPDYSGAGYRESEHMSELMSLMQRRRSIRKFTSEPISKEDLEAVVQAGLLAPSGRSLCPVEFIAVQDRILLDKLAHARVGAAKMLEGAAAAIVVIADKDKSDTIIEDSSIAMMNMLLMATELGLGSCWIQGRMREAENKEQTTEAYVRDVLGFPENYQLEAMVALGHPAQERPAYDLKDLHYEKVHPDTF